MSETVLLECAYFCPERTYELTSVKERQSCKLGYIDLKYVARIFYLENEHLGSETASLMIEYNWETEDDKGDYSTQLRWTRLDGYGSRFSSIMVYCSLMGKLP